MEALENILRKFNNIQMKYSIQIFIVVLIVTAFLVSQLPNLAFSSDLQEQLPQDIPSIQASERISDNIGGEELVIVLFELDISKEDGVNDIRDPEVIEAIHKIHSRLEKEGQIDEVSSIATVFADGDIPETIDGVKHVFDQIEGVDNFFNRKYTATLMDLSVTIPEGEDKIEELVGIINDNIDSVSKPFNLEVTTTGIPPIRDTVMGLLEEDVILTTTLAGVFIFIFIIVIKKSLKWSIAIFLPLIFGLAWTFGIVAFLGIRITIATVFIGAMLLGMGIEYGAFMVERYIEEVSDNPTDEEIFNGLNIAVPSVGSSIIGSSSTATASFLALLIATIPMVRELGAMLALGIMNSLFAVILLDPIIIRGLELIDRKLSTGDNDD